MSEHVYRKKEAQDSVQLIVIRELKIPLNSDTLLAVCATVRFK